MKKSNRPLVSIIIPVYNVRPYLEECLDSVVNQTYKNIEIIVIDDGSNDGSGELCDEYHERDQRVQVIHQENKGLSAARNAGLDRMSGSLISFLDGDDAYHPEMIRLMVEIIQKYDGDIAVCNFKHCQTTKRMISPAIYTDCSEKKIIIYTSEKAQQALFYKKISIVVWNKLFSSELWKNKRFPVGRVFEDWMTIYPIFERSKRVIQIDQKLVMYRIRSDSITNTKSVSNTLDFFLALDCFDYCIEEHVPDLFTKKQFLKMKEEHFCIKIYRCCLCMFYLTNENRMEYNELREKLMIEAKEQNEQFLMFRTHVIYSIFKFTPFLLPLIGFFNHLYRSVKYKSPLR